MPVPGKSDDQEFPDDFAEGMMDDHEKNNDKALVEVQQQHRLYTFGGRFWQVPEHFAFSKDTKLLLGWRLWVAGQVGYEYLNRLGKKQLAPVQPFRILKKKMLPKEVRKKFSLSWEPIFRMMEQADGTNLDDDPMESFKIGYEYLKTWVGYVFRGKRMNLET